MNATSPNILEIGLIPLMRAGFPGTTEFWSIHHDVAAPPGPRSRTLSVATLPLLARRIADPSFDLIVVQPTHHAPWSLRWLSRGIFRRSALRGSIPYFRVFGTELLRGPLGAPLAVWDWDDQPFIFRHNLFLLRRSTLYFKRELPTDHWRLYMGSRHFRVPPMRFRLLSKERMNIAKVRPISIGLPNDHLKNIPARPLPAAEKTADVFFAGRIVGSATTREHGLDEVRALQDKGIRVDIPDRELSVAEFLDRCARAWLVWSPEGFGHECFRTYEAAACGAVPIVNRPTIHQYRPLRDREHCYLYDVEPGGLTRVIEAALEDRDRLMAMSVAAQDFVLAHHTHAALAHYVAETTLAAASGR